MIPTVAKYGLLLYFVMYCSAVSKFGVDDAVFVSTYILRSKKVYRKCLEHTPERGRRVLSFHTAAPKVGPHARAWAHTRPRHRRGVGEGPHVRGSVERTASLAVAKPRCSGGQTLGAAV